MVHINREIFDDFRTGILFHTLGSELGTHIDINA